MIANANYNSSPTASIGYGEEGTIFTVYLVAEPVYRDGPSICPDCFLKPINLFKEDEFYPDVEGKKLIRMEKKQFNFPLITRINRGRG